MATRCVVGVDVGGTKMLAGVVDERLQVHARAHRPTEGMEQNVLVETLTEVIEELRRATPHTIEAVGLGIPAMIDQDRGVALNAINLPITNLALRDVMAERVGLPVTMDNDGNLTALAEQRHGAARGYRHVVALTVGTGIGGGLILDGELYRGSIGAGAELGHMVIDVNGPPCQGFCPNRGCLETYASGTALVRLAREIAAERPDSAMGKVVASGRELTGPLVTELAFDGDQAAVDALTKVGTYLGVGIASYVNIFNPEAVVVGGGVIAAGELLLAPARAEVERRAPKPLKEMVQIVPTAFGAEAGMIGAATLALDVARARSEA
jgi:glucokinase